VNPQYEAVARRARQRCEYCRAPELIFNGLFEIDHVVPTAEGGSDDPVNLALACRTCNGRKGGFQTGTDPSTGSKVRLFNPRLDRWEDHFRFDGESCELIGLTDIGRATVDRLDLNHPCQLGARAVWAALRYYP
jgi:hypothetical protein